MNERLEVSIRKKLKLFDLNLEFQMEQGVLGILGPSGCGKSMTLKSIAGIVAPDGGRISVENPDGSEKVLFDSDRRVNLAPQKRKIGYLFQNYALFPNMTVFQNIEAGLGRNRLSRPQVRERIEKMIRKFQLEGLEHQYPAQLSGGQQQRAALARIFAGEPSMLLLDEPFSAMDAFLREKLRLELTKVLKEYHGISILVTHDRDEAYQLCDHLLLMKEGKILKKGPVKELFDRPEKVEAAILTGCKNISRIEPMGEHKVKALDWGGLELVTEEKVTQEITHIGIRAHDFVPVGETEALTSNVASKALTETEPENLIPVIHPKVSEMPFEWYIILENGLWWKTGKNLSCHDEKTVIPKALRVDPKAVLLLKD